MSASQKPSASGFIKTNFQVTHPSTVLYNRDRSPFPLDITIAVIPSNPCTPRKSSLSPPSGTAHFCQLIPPIHCPQHRPARPRSPRHPATQRVNSTQARRRVRVLNLPLSPRHRREQHEKKTIGAFPQCTWECSDFYSSSMPSQSYFFQLRIRPDPAALDPGLQILIEHGQRYAACCQNCIVEGSEIEFVTKHFLGVCAFLLDLGHAEVVGQRLPGATRYNGRSLPRCHARSALCCRADTAEHPRGSCPIACMPVSTTRRDARHAWKLNIPNFFIRRVIHIHLGAQPFAVERAQPSLNPEF